VQCAKKLRIRSWLKGFEVGDNQTQQSQYFGSPYIHDFGTYQRSIALIGRPRVTATLGRHLANASEMMSKCVLANPAMLWLNILNIFKLSSLKPQSCIVTEKNSELYCVEIALE